MRKLALALLFIVPASAQVMDATHIGESVELKGDWRIHTGDNPDWAKPDFDDSKWRLITTKKTWDQQGLESIRGYVWYRTTVMLPSQHGQLSLLFNEAGPQDFYLDGKKVGSFGRFPPDPSPVDPFPRVYPVPPNVSELHIALRFWITPLAFHIGNMANDMTIGTKDAIHRRFQEFIDSTLVNDIPGFIVGIFNAIVCVGLIILFGLQRERTEYLYLALALFAALALTIESLSRGLMSWPIAFGDYVRIMTSAIMAICMIEFVFRFLGHRVTIPWRVYQVSMAFLWVAVMAAWNGWVPTTVLNTGFFLYFVPYWFTLPGMLVFRFIKGNKEAGLLAIPLFLLMLDDVLGTLNWILFELHVRSSATPFVPSLHLARVTVDPQTIYFFLFLLSVAALIMMRFQKTRLEQARAHAELEAARSMQEVMVPKAVSTTGFQIETAYIPAQEVGGDFFQLFPDEDGSLLVVIGDVSGKGMKAAMLVSMILGLLRRTVVLTRSPAEILRDINLLLIGHTDEKFATCCCALLNPDGSMLAANAGHLSPYCDGKEVELPGGLPLGVSAEADYREVRFDVPPGKRWVFLSDGVVEARNKAGELYGFERTRMISIRAVNDIAQSAQRFGQEDDITVLGVAPLQTAHA